MGLAKPTGGYAEQMIDPGGWPEVDEDAFYDRARDYTRVLQQVTEVLEACQHQRGEIFDGGIWSGEAAGAAHGELGAIVNELVTLQSGLATVVTWQQYIGGSIVQAKSDISDNVDVAHTQINVLENDVSLDDAERTTAINTVVGATHAANSGLVAAAGEQILASKAWKPADNALKDLLDQKTPPLITLPVTPAPPVPGVPTVPGEHDRPVLDPPRPGQPLPDPALPGQPLPGPAQPVPVTPAPGSPGGPAPVPPVAPPPGLTVPPLTPPATGQPPLTPPATGQPPVAPGPRNPAVPGIPGAGPKEPAVPPVSADPGVPVGPEPPLGPAVPANPPASTPPADAGDRGKGVAPAAASGIPNSLAPKAPEDSSAATAPAAATGLPAAPVPPAAGGPSAGRRAGSAAPVGQSPSATQPSTRPAAARPGSRTWHADRPKQEQPEPPATPAPIAPIPVSAARAARDAMAEASTADAARRRGDPLQVARRIGAALNAPSNGGATDFGFFWVTALTTDGMIVVANSYGLAYIPEGVQLPEQVHMATADDEVPAAERARWATYPIVAVQAWAARRDTKLRAVIGTEEQLANSDPGAAKVVLEPDDIPEIGGMVGRSRLQVVDPEAADRLGATPDPRLTSLLPPAPADANAPADRRFELWFDAMKPMMSRASGREAAHLRAFQAYAAHAQELALAEAHTAADLANQRSAVADWLYWKHLTQLLNGALADF